MGPHLKHPDGSFNWRGLISSRGYPAVSAAGDSLLGAGFVEMNEESQGLSLPEGVARCIGKLYSERWRDDMRRDAN